MSFPFFIEVIKALKPCVEAIQVHLKIYDNEKRNYNYSQVFDQRRSRKIQGEKSALRISHENQGIQS